MNVPLLRSRKPPVITGVRRLLRICAFGKASRRFPSYSTPSMILQTPHMASFMLQMCISSTSSVSTTLLHRGIISEFFSNRPDHLSRMLSSVLRQVLEFSPFIRMNLMSLESIFGLPMVILPNVPMETREFPNDECKSSQYRQYRRGWTQHTIS